MFDDFPFETVTELQARGILEVADGNHGNDRPRSEEFGSGNTSFIRAADMDGGRVLFESAERINDMALTRIRKGKGKPGDILFSSKGTVGKLALVQMNAPPFVCSPQTTYWRTLDEKQLDRTFLYAFMQSTWFIEQWEAIKGDTDMAPYASLTSQRQFRVPLPDIKFQRNVAGVFRPLDNKIALNRRMNRTLEELAAALFRSWFVDFDPVVAKAAGRQPAHLRPELAALFPATWQDSSLGPIPHGWRVGQVDELASLTRGGINPGEFPTETFDHYSIPAFDDGCLPRQELGGTIKSNKFPVPPGCVMISKLNPDTPRIWLPDVTGERRAVCSTEFLVSTPKPPTTREFLFSLFSSETFVSSFATLVTGTSGSHQRVKPDGLLTTEVVIPNDPLISEFTKLVRPWLAQVTHNIHESRTLAALRDTLLPKLLSGELRVKSAEQLVEASA